MGQWQSRTAGEVESWCGVDPCNYDQPCAVHRLADAYEVFMDENKRLREALERIQRYEVPGDGGDFTALDMARFARFTLRDAESEDQTTSGGSEAGAGTAPPDLNAAAEPPEPSTDDLFPVEGPEPVSLRGCTEHPEGCPDGPHVGNRPQSEEGA